MARKFCPKFPPNRCIAIDVDGTLIRNGRLNRKLADWAKDKKEEGFDVILWTARGRAHAERVAVEHELTGHFTAIVGKPGYIVDDVGWSWIKYVAVVKKLF